MTCFGRCPTISGTTISGVWTELRYHYGPRSISVAQNNTLYAVDILEFNTWALGKGKDINDYGLFGRWFNWRLSIGTTDYGNLPSNKVNDHEGISCIPCPYDDRPDNISTASWAIRTDLWLGEAPTPVTHEDILGKHYYLKVASRGNVWGFECTFPECPYNITNGYSYFHV